MSGLHHITVEIVICEYGASDRSDADRLVLHSEFLNRFGHQSVCYTMGTARAVMERNIRKHLCFFKYYCHLIREPPSI